MEEIAVKLVLDDDLTSRFKKASGEVKKESTKMASAIDKVNTTVKNLIVAYVGMQGIRAGVNLMKDAAKAASDLEEAHSKAIVTWNGYGNKLSESIDTLTTSYAMSKREANEYLGAMMDLLVPLGINKKASSDLSSEIVKLSADLGSFNNMPTAQVMGDIQSALVGNYETMKKYGVVLNETVVSEKARKDGLHSGKGLLDAATKAQTAYKLIVEASGFAIGDMKRTADGWANTMKALNARWEDFSAALGTFIINSPTVKEAIKEINEDLKKMTDALFYDQNKAKETALSSQLKQLREDAKAYGDEIAALELQLKGITKEDVQNANLYDQTMYNDAQKRLDMLRAAAQIVKEDISRLEKSAPKDTETGEKSNGAAKLPAPAQSLFISDALNKELQGQVKTVLDKQAKYEEKAKKDSIKRAQELKDARESIRQSEVDSDLQMQIDKYNQEQQMLQNQMSRYEDYAMAVGQALASGIGEGAEGVKESLKAMLTVFLSAIEKEILIGFVGAGARAMMGDFSGLIQMAGVTAAFEAAKAGVSAFAKGGDFMTNGPQMIMVGDNPGGREHVQVTPTSSPNYNGPKSGNMSVSMGNVYINGNADASTVSALNMSREKQLRQMRQMLKELGYARQTPSFA